MIEQVANGQWMFSGIRTFIPGLHFLPLELWNVFLHQVIEFQIPFVDHHHNGDRNERLVTRRPKNIGGLQRFFFLYPPANRINGGNLSIARNQSNHARTLPTVDDCLKVMGNPR